MGKMYRSCTTNTCCTKKLNEVIKPVPEKWYESELGEELRSLMVKKNKDEFTLSISELICHEPIPRCAEKIAELTLLLAQSFVTGNKPSDYEEYKKITAKTNSEWPTCGQLNLLSGMEAIERYIESLHPDPTLKYCVNFLMQKVDKLSSAFLYEASICN